MTKITQIPDAEELLRLAENLDLIAKKYDGEEQSALNRTSEIFREVAQSQQRADN
jgi:hypothetical protein